MKPKTIPFILLIALSLLSGCNKKPAAPTENKSAVEIKVAFWGSPEEIDIVTQSMAGWQKAHPNISVRFEHTPYTGYDSKILTRIAGGAAPDVIAAEVNYFVTFATRDVFLSLNSFIKDDKDFLLDDFFAPIIDRFTVNGQVLAIPRDVAPFACVFYNKDLFDQAGLPYPTDDWTWDDMLNLAKKLTKKDAAGRVIQYGFYGWAWQNFIYGNGGGLVDDVKSPTKTILDDPKSVEGLQFYTDLINKYEVMPTPLALANLGMGVDMMFASGRLAMFLSGIWETPALRAKYSFHWDVAMFPKNRDGVRHFGSGGTGYGILKSSKYRRESWEVVKALTSPEVQAQMAERGLAQPSLRTVAQGEHWAGSPLPPANKKMLNEAVTNIIFDPFHTKWREIEAKYITPELDLVKLGKETAEAAAQKIVPKINEALQEKN